MKTIYKYKVPINSEFHLLMPIGAKILCLQMQNNEPYIWALVSPTMSVEDVYFEILTTGGPAAAIAREYVGTFQKDGFVGHVFMQ